MSEAQRSCFDLYRVQYSVLKSRNSQENGLFMGISLDKIDVETSNWKWILFER